MSNSQSRMRSAVLGVLVPLARMMLNFGLDARDATALVKTAFVKAAQVEYGDEDGDIDDEATDWTEEEEL